MKKLINKDTDGQGAKTQPTDRSSKKSFFTSVIDGLNSKCASFVYYLLSLYAFFFFKNSSFAYGWMAALYPFGEKFPTILLTVIAATAVIQIVFLVLLNLSRTKKISGNKAFKIIHIVFGVLSIALFVYTFVVLFNLDKGFIADNFRQGLNYFKSTILLFGILAFLPLPFVFLLEEKHSIVKTTALVLVVCLLVLPLNFMKITSSKSTADDFEKLDFGTENLLDGTVSFETLKKDEKPDGVNALTDDDRCWTAQCMDGKPGENCSNSNNAYLEIKLKKPTTFNTCTIEELGNEAQYFRLQADVDGKFITLSRGEKIQSLKVCSFDAVTTDTMRLSIDKFRSVDTPVNIKSIKIYNVEKAPRSAEVATYQRLDYQRPSEILAKGEEYAKNFAKFYDVYTTVIIFDAVHHDLDGNLNFGDEGEENFAKEVESLRKLIDMRSNKNHSVKLIVTGLANGLGGEGGGVNVFMAKNLEKVAENIKNVVLKYDFDGVDIDWEYPQNADDWANFDRFIKLVDEGISSDGRQRIISTALDPYQPYASKESYDIIDQIQYMAYDADDVDHYQSSLQEAQEGINHFVEAGADKSKINIGIGIYARPLNHTPYWAIWKDLQTADYYNDMYTSIIDGNEVYDGTFCSPATAGNKMTYALFSGCGGVMTFRIDTDKLPDDKNSVSNGIKSVCDRYIENF